MARVSVVGGSSVADEVLDLARDLGAALARERHEVVCGGLGGTMEAVAEGAKRAGGVVIGILPGTKRMEANGHVTLPIATGLGHARNALVVLNGDALIALPGSGGTMSEIGLALAHGRPVVGLGAWSELGVEQVGSVEEALAWLAEVLAS